MSKKAREEDGKRLSKKSFKGIRSKKDLEVVLSRIKGFQVAKVRAEQYMTESSIAAEVLWNAYFRGLVEDKIIADLGCGTGMLGIGALLLGASKVYFVDNDPEALEIAKNNLENIKSEGFCLGEAEIILKDINEWEFNQKVDFVIQNPPFGTKEKHADKDFLMKAFSISNEVYSFHKIETERFVRAISSDYGFRIIERFDFDFPIKKSMDFHTKKVEHIKVGCWIMERAEK